MLVRPSRSCQRCSSQACPRARFAVSDPSRAYSRTFVSTKTSAVMRLVPGQVAIPRLFQPERPLGQKAPHRFLVLARLAHAIAQDFAHEARQADAAARGVDARPGGGFLVEGDSDVFHGRFTRRLLQKHNITRILCNIAGASRLAPSLHPRPRDLHRPRIAHAVGGETWHGLELLNSLPGMIRPCTCTRDSSNRQFQTTVPEAGWAGRGAAWNRPFHLSVAVRRVARSEITDKIRSTAATSVVLNASSPAGLRGR